MTAMLAVGNGPDAPVATGWTPLVIAAAEGHEGVVAALLEAAADSNVKNQLGRTALMFASSKGFTTIVKNLLARGADPNVAPTDEHGWTALMGAARTGRVETVQALLRGAADVTLKDENGNTALLGRSLGQVSPDKPGPWDPSRIAKTAYSPRSEVARPGRHPGGRGASGGAP